MNNIQKIMPWLALLLLFLSNFGCISSTNWRPKYSSKVPWCDPGIKAEVYTKKITYFMAPKFTTKVKWTNPEKILFSSITRNDIEKEIDDFFYKHPEFIKSWPKDSGMSYTHYSYGDINRRKCPYLLFLVSIMPTVVLGTEKPTSEYIQWGHSDDYDSVFSSYLTTSTIKVTTILPLSKKVWWFAPKISNKIEIIDLSEDQGIIKLPKDNKLSIIVKQNTLSVIRE